MACETRATATIGTELQLNVGNESTPSWQKFYAIKSYSGFNNEPETIDVTTMDADKYTQKIRGLIDLGNLTFDVNSSAELVQLANSVKGDMLDWRVIRKQTGEYHRIKGELVYNWADGSVNDGNFGTLTIIPCYMSDVMLEPLKVFTETAPTAVSVGVSEQKTQNWAMTEKDANIAVSVADPNKAYVAYTETETGATFYITGKEAGTTTAKIKLSKVGFASKELTFSITVTA